MKARISRRRLLSLILCLVLCLSLMPVAASAAEITGDDHITFSSTEAFSISAPKVWTDTIWYSTDNEEWTVWDGSSVSAAKSDGTYYLCFRGSGNSAITGSSTNKWTLSASADVECSGNIMTLLDYEAPEEAQISAWCFGNMFNGWTKLTKAPELPAETLANYCYALMFQNCTSLTQAPALPAKTAKYGCYSCMFYGCSSLTQAPAILAETLAAYCCQSMFYGCTSLTQAPALPATTLAERCYARMFYGCTSLTQAPALPAETLADYCYSYMFQNCTSLTQAPALPATTLADYCYNYMFQNCTSLTQAPALPATTLADYCCQSMFYGCTSLTKAPALPAKTAKYGCYSCMFYGCSSLTQAPAILAETLADYCCHSMFYGCSSLTQAPALPATTLADYCYSGMFENCTRLTDAPELPAQTMKTSCYYTMFKNCRSLTAAPELPATTLATRCYNYMFSYCTSLTKAPVLPATELKERCYDSMFSYCVNLKLYKTGSGESWSIPADAIEASYWNLDMFATTGGDIDRAPTIGTKYYYSQVVAYTVTFEMNGHGTAIDAQTVVSGAAPQKPSDPAEEGCTFGGWYADAALNTPFDFDSAIEADTTVYAKWTAAGGDDNTTTITVKVPEATYTLTIPTQVIAPFGEYNLDVGNVKVTLDEGFCEGKNLKINAKFSEFTNDADASEKLPYTATSFVVSDSMYFAYGLGTRPGETMVFRCNYDSNGTNVFNYLLKLTFDKGAWAAAAAGSYTATVTFTGEIVNS